MCDKSWTHKNDGPLYTTAGHSDNREIKPLLTTVSNARQSNFQTDLDSGYTVVSLLPDKLSSCEVSDVITGWAKARTLFYLFQIPPFLVIARIESRCTASSTNNKNMRAQWRHLITSHWRHATLKEHSVKGTLLSALLGIAVKVLRVSDAPTLSMITSRGNIRKSSDIWYCF